MVLLHSLNLRYLIQVKPGDHEALFDADQSVTPPRSSPPSLAIVRIIRQLCAGFGNHQHQELSCRLFQAARAHFRSRTSLWERLRALFTGYYIPDWKTLWEAIAAGHVPSVLVPDTS